MDTNEQIAKIIYHYAKHVVEQHANNLFLSRKEVAASVCHTEEERQALMDVTNVTYIMNLKGSSLTLGKKEQGEEPLAEKLVNEGKPTPYSGGKDGIVTEITGVQRPSNVPKQMPGQPLPEYGWESTGFK